MNHFRACAALLALALFAPHAATPAGAAEATTGILTGNVLDVHDKPVPNARISTLFAGQSLDHYPQFLPLQRLARTFNLSAQEVWRLERQQVPISGASLIVYGNLLSAFGQTFLNDRYRAIRKENRSRFSG